VGWWDTLLIVRRVSLRDFRSYGSLELALEPGIVLITGPNGAGKTNLLEALHVGSQGFSPRTRADARLIRFGAEAARVALSGDEQGSPVETQVDVRGAKGKEVRVNGATLTSTDELRLRLSALAFTPDRLAVVKGGPLVRRAYFDRMLGRLFPARAGLPGDFGRALAQRNAALRRVRAGESSRDAVEPWTQRVAELGDDLDRRRSELVGLLAPRFRAKAALLGLENAELEYEERGLTVEELNGRLEADVERGTTGVGPHLRDVGVWGDGRDLRRYGSQGEQRSAVLALVVAEGDLVAGQRAAPPLLLLDDVFSELDEGRRLALVTSLPAGSQTLVTMTDRGAYPASGPDPALVVSVRREEDASLAEAA
jgi:DNA replication and repair protein RecF